MRFMHVDYNNNTASLSANAFIIAYNNIIII